MQNENLNGRDKNCKIAVIGIGCIYPGAKSPLQFWENILTRRQQFRKMPDTRMPGSEYHDPDPTIQDKSYQNRAAVIDGYNFNWLEKRIPKGVFESTDIVHWLALDTALQALSDSGMDLSNVPKDKTGVIFGNTLTGEFTRANNMRLRWPYVRKALRASLKKKGLENIQSELETVMESYYKSVFPEVTEDSLAGGLANTIAGRVCNYLDLHGGGYIVDGACSSSLLAIVNAANALELGQMDMAIAGGVDVSLDTFELIGFSKTGALSKTEMRVYDKRGNGFIPGEGCGVVIMKRLDDAIRDKNPVYATLKGWGISSDGKGGITAPSAQGQATALKRAHRKANFAPENLNFIEGHGTGTTVGDKIELEGISIALSTAKEPLIKSCGVTSLKSIIGHTKAAAGIGAFIKTVIALNRRVLPPTAGIQELNPIFADKARAIYPIMRGQLMDPNSKLHAGVSAMGFGGINSHVVLESGDQAMEKFQPPIAEDKLMVSNQTHELYLFTGKDFETLSERVEEALIQAKGMSIAELVDFASANNQKIDQGAKYRASVVAGMPAELIEKLESLLRNISEHGIEKYTSLEGDSVVLGKKKDSITIGGVFPGQGSQRINMCDKLVKRHDWAKEMVQKADEIFVSEGTVDVPEYIFKVLERAADNDEEKLWKSRLKQTNIAQPAITLASLIWKKHLENLGLKLGASTGHSLGELMAFSASGLIDETTVLQFAAFRGNIMAGCGSGTMASLVCSEEMAQEFIDSAPGYAVVANLNSPRQTVISGDDETIDFIVEEAGKRSISAVSLPVAAAFHSKLVGGAAGAIQNFTPLNKHMKKRSNFSLVSSVTGQQVEDGIDLNTYFSEQSVGQVKFVDAINTMKEQCDVLIEIGPGKVLSGLVDTIQDEVKCFAVESRADDDKSLQITLANLFVMGMDINIPELYRNRLVRDFVAASEKDFIVNPCERPFPEIEVDASVSSSNSIPQLNYSGKDADEYWNVRADFINELIHADMKYFSSNGEKVVDSEKKVSLQAHANTDSPKRTESLVGESIQSVLYSKIQAITGFPLDGYTEDMKLLDDFNLDSIKAASLLNDVIKTFGLQGKINAANFSNASLSGILSEMNKIESRAITKPASPASTSSGDIESHVYDLIANKTGFPKEELKSEFRLLDDLNLDSIKAGTLLAELIKKYNLQGKIEAAAHANASINEIVLAIREFVSSDTSTLVTEITEEKDDVQAFLFSQIEDKTGFPAEELKPDFKLLDDLNLDSIKANTLVSAVFKKYDLLGKVEVAKYANASLSEIIEAVGVPVVQVQTDTTKAPPAEIPQNRVSSFTVGIGTEELHITDEEVNSYWKGRKVALISSAEDGKASRGLKKSITQKAGFVQHIQNNELLTLDAGFDNLLVILPADPTDGKLDEVVQTLSAVAAYKNNDDTQIGFVQFGDGYFGKNHQNKNICSTIFSATGFAASLHLERPNSRIHVIEFDSSLSQTFIGNRVLNEVAEERHFKMIGYNKVEGRVKLAYDVADEILEKRKKPTINKKDVFLITGGAKGITATCGLALARKYKCKVALVGSSPFNGEDGEIKDTLQKYEKDGLTASYFTCDISDWRSTINMVEEVESTLGKVSGIVHGAGKNVPRRSETVSYNEAMDEISPKVMGAVNLYGGVDADHLKYYIALTSIIGVTGMAGNSWYAFSNEFLDLFLRQIRSTTNTETLALAYSVWSELGMGERMGSTKALSHMGIDAIPPQKGVEEFLKWIEYDSNDQQIVIASKLGGLDTWNRKSVPIDNVGRYLEKIVYFEPDIELKARTSLNEKTDLYVNDHNYKGSLLFPTVFGLEAMAQAVSMLTGIKQFKSLTLENISLLRPIVVPGNGETEIEINAILLEDDNSRPSVKRVQVGISTEHTNFSDDHFSALFVLGDIAENNASEVPLDLSTPLAISPKSDLYSWLLFQGPKFQLIDSLYEVDKDKAVFTTKIMETDSSDTCFPKDRRAPFILGSPLLRDTLLQSAQLMLTKQVLLPIAIDRWEMMNIGVQRKGGTVKCEFVNWDEDTAICDVVYLNDENKLIERIKGYRIKTMEPTAHFPNPEELAAIPTRFKDKFNEEFTKYGNLIDSNFECILYKHNADFHALTKAERRAVERKALHGHLSNGSQLKLNLDKDLLKWAENGKPFLASKKADISISHSYSMLLMTLGKLTQGCDIERIEHREVEEWKNLFDFKFTDTVEQMRAGGIDEEWDSCYTRIWGVREACMKAHGFIPVNISVNRNEDKAVIFEVTHQKNVYHILTFPFELLPKNNYMVTLIVQPVINEIEMPKEEVLSLDNAFDALSQKFATHFYATFKDCKGFYGKTYFIDFPLWMGSLREHILTPVKKKLLNDLGSGEFGMVTNDSTIKVYGEASTLDKITGKIWITEDSDLKNSVIDLAYEWFKQTEDGKTEKLADCTLSTTWVKIEDRGIVKTSPIPSYFYDFLEKYQKKTGGKIELPQLKVSFPKIQDLGKVVYESKAAPRPEILLNTKLYHTGLSNSNTVGNLYYSNYYDWQAKNIEAYLFNLVPDVFLKNGKEGEFLCLESNTIHLQEAMPFEDIEVRMYLEKAYDCGMKLHFEFFSVGSDYKRKLAYGSNVILWAKRSNENEQAKAQALPESILHACFEGKSNMANV